MIITCAVHGGSESVARCSACGARMCDACFRFMIAEDPACVRCARELSTRSRRRVALGVFTALVSVGSAALVGVRKVVDPWPAFAAAFGLFGALAGIYLAARRPARDLAQAMRPRQPHEHPPDLSSDGDARVGRARARLALAAVGPSLSGRLTALSALLAMSLAAVSFPRLLHFSRWVELEVVLFSWWAMAALGLALVLYYGLRVDDDHYFYAAEVPLAGHQDLKGKLKGGDGRSGCDAGCDPAVGGCEETFGLLAIGLAALAAVAAAVLVAWVVVEIILPLAFFAFYLTATAALRRAAHDRHDCQGRGLASLRWGIVWATVYIAPLALTLFALHTLAERVP